METSFPLVVGSYPISDTRHGNNLHLKDFDLMSMPCVRINFLFVLGSFAHKSGVTRTIPQVAIMAPRIELLNRIVCYSVRPEYAGTSTGPSQPDPSLCAADPVVQAAVAQLLIGVVLFHLGHHDLGLSSISTFHLLWSTLMPNDVMVDCCGFGIIVLLTEVDLILFSVPIVKGGSLWQVLEYSAWFYSTSAS